MVQMKAQVCPMVAVRASFLQFTWHLFTDLLNFSCFVGTNCLLDIFKHIKNKFFKNIVFKE